MKQQQHEKKRVEIYLHTSLHKCFIRHIRLELATLILKQSTTYYHTNMHQFLFHFVGMAVIKQSTQLIAEHSSANKC